jgi:hypothetical protein
MRKFGSLILFAALAVVAISLAEAQQGGFGKGGFGKGVGVGQNYFTLVNNPQVKSEVKITDEQVAKFPAAELKALSEVLDKGQVKRLKEIYLRQKGNQAYLEADVKQELKITDAQVTKIKAALEKQQKDQAEMFQNGFDADRSQEIQKTATAEVLAALTDAQKTQWTKMIGEPFEMKGGFGGGKGFGKKKDQ